MEEIDVREKRCVQVEVPIGGKRRRPIDGWRHGKSHELRAKHPGGVWG
jgi:hypothetical protein